MPINTAIKLKSPLMLFENRARIKKINPLSTLPNIFGTYFNHGNSSAYPPIFLIGFFNRSRNGRMKKSGIKTANKPNSINNINLINPKLKRNKGKDTKQ